MNPSHLKYYNLQNTSTYIYVQAFIQTCLVNSSVPVSCLTPIPSLDRSSSINHVQIKRIGMARSLRSWLHVFTTLAEALDCVASHPGFRNLKNAVGYATDCDKELEVLTRTVKIVLGTRRLEGETRPAELMAQSEDKVSVVCDHPPGPRDEPAKPDNGTPLAPSSPFSLSDNAVARVFSPRATSCSTTFSRRRVPPSSTSDGHASPRSRDCGR